MRRIYCVTRRLTTLPMSCDPTGNRRGSKRHQTPLRDAPPTEPPAAERGEATAGVCECNDALDAARLTIAASRRLVLVAHNALVNGDLPRARTVLREILDAAAPVATTAPRHSVRVIATS